MNSVNYQMSLDEHLRTGFRRKMFRPRFMLFVASLVFCGAFLVIGSSAKGPFFYAGVVFLVYGALVPVQLYFVLRRFLTKFSWFTAPTTMTFGDSGLAITAPDYRSELGWSQFRSWSQSGDYLFLFLDGGNTALTIPKRAFGPEQLQNFMTYVSRLKG
jgi:hypothetical protein